MAAWHKPSACWLMLAVATAASAARVDLGPASQEAILAPANAFTTDGRALMRDHVLLAVTPGAQGACVVSAQAAPGFSAKRLLGDLQRLFGARIRSDAPPVLILSKGEMMRFNSGSRAGGRTYIQLALVAAKGN